MMFQSCSKLAIPIREGGDLDLFERFRTTATANLMRSDVMIPTAYL